MKKSNKIKENVKEKNNNNVSQQMEYGAQKLHAHIYAFI